MTFERGWLSEEMSGADLGDARLSWRLGNIVAALSERPGKTLPKALVTSASLEATYRFMSNDAVTPDAILAPHIAATCDRAEAARVALAIHDTTELAFAGEARTGLGRLTTSRSRGFFAHVCMAVDAQTARPLGILGTQTWTRMEPPPSTKKRATYQFKTREQKESQRWGELVQSVHDLTHARARVIHVMDREADNYRLLAQIADAGGEFVVRASHLERRLADGRTLEQRTDSVEVRLIREVPLTKRIQHKDSRRGRYAPRVARSATLLVGTTPVTMKRSWATPTQVSPTVQLNAVRVWEPEPPDGEHPVEWQLLTNLPIQTQADLELVIDAYRRRWLIEELFKALKTGCRFEELQLESGEALRNALAVMLPVAVGLLALRHVARSAADRPASDVLTELQLRVLQVYEHTKHMPLNTARDALLAVARLGGHIKNNGDPGWIVLGRGYEDLVTLERGARIAFEM